MFHAKIKTNSIKNAIQALTVLIDEIRIKITPDGLFIKAVDPSNVAMVDLELSKPTFDFFEATELELALDLSRLSNILEMAGSDDIIEFDLNESDHKLIIKMTSIAYTMSLLDPVSLRKEPKIPNLELPGQIVISCDDLKRAIKASSKISDYITFEIRDKKFIMEARNEIDSVFIEKNQDQLISLSGLNCKSLFSLDYLIKLNKIFGLSPEITLDLGSDMPIMLCLRICDNHGILKYMIAPRVESD